MDCSTAEGMVNRYINHSLSEKDTEHFLEHIEKCSSCYDELETYFIVHEATKQLDKEDEDSILDIKGLLEQDIRKRKKELIEHKILSQLGFLLTTGCIVVFVIYFLRVLLNYL